MEKRYLVLAEGKSGDPHYGKTARGVIRYSPHPVVAVLDSVLVVAGTVVVVVWVSVTVSGAVVDSDVVVSVVVVSVDPVVVAARARVTDGCVPSSSPATAATARAGASRAVLPSVSRRSAMARTMPPLRRATGRTRRR